MYRMIRTSMDLNAPESPRALTRNRRIPKACFEPAQFLRRFGANLRLCWNRSGE